MATIYYEKDADPALIKDRRVAVIGYGSQGHAHALNMKESGIDVVVGLEGGLELQGQGRGRGSDGHDAGRGGRVGQRRDAAGARSAHGRPLSNRHRPQPRPRRRPAVRPRVQHPLRGDRAARRRRRAHGGPQGTGTSGQAHLHRRLRGAVPAGRPSGRHRQGQRPRPLLRLGHRRDQGRRAADDFQRRDRDRPVRRAGDPLRRPRPSWSRTPTRPWSRPATSPSRPTSRLSTS